MISQTYPDTGPGRKERNLRNRIPQSDEGGRNPPSDKGRRNRCSRDERGGDLVMHNLQLLMHDRRMLVNQRCLLVQEDGLLMQHHKEHHKEHHKQHHKQHHHKGDVLIHQSMRPRE
jgi:hypothetical protein